MADEGNHLYGRIGRMALLFVGVLLPLALFGISRIYGGVHYPSDIVAGWAASLAWVVGAEPVLDHRQRRDGGKGATSPKAA